MIGLKVDSLTKLRCPFFIPDGFTVLVPFSKRIFIFSIALKHKLLLDIALKFKRKQMSEASITAVHTALIFNINKFSVLVQAFERIIELENSK